MESSPAAFGHASGKSDHLFMKCDGSYGPDPVVGSVCRTSAPNQKLPMNLFDADRREGALISAIVVSSPAWVAVGPAAVPLAVASGPLAEPDSAPDGVNSRGRSEASLADPSLSATKCPYPRGRRWSNPPPAAPRLRQAALFVLEAASARAGIVPPHLARGGAGQPLSPRVQVDLLSISPRVGVERSVERPLAA